jgi:hypothetical protein
VRLAQAAFQEEKKRVLSEIPVKLHLCIDNISVWSAYDEVAEWMLSL